MPDGLFQQSGSSSTSARVLPRNSESPLHTNGWAAVVNWYGPYRTRDDCADSAEKLAARNLPDFGLYMVIGKLKRFSLMRKKVLYIGKNGSDSELSLAQRIRVSGGLNKAEEYSGKKGYWFGLLVGPQRVMHKIGAGEADQQLRIFSGDEEWERKYWIDEARRTERALISSLNPLLNEVDLTFPDYHVAVTSRSPDHKKGKRKSGWRRGIFHRLVPSYVELLPAAGGNGRHTIDLTWTCREGAPSARLRKSFWRTRWGPSRTRRGFWLFKFGNSKIWEPWGAERLWSKVPPVQGARDWHALLRLPVAVLIALTLGAASPHFFDNIEETGSSAQREAAAVPPLRRDIRGDVRSDRAAAAAVSTSQNDTNEVGVRFSEDGNNEAATESGSSGEAEVIVEPVAPVKQSRYVAGDGYACLRATDPRGEIICDVMIEGEEHVVSHGLDIREVRKVYDLEDPQ